MRRAGAGAVGDGTVQFGPARLTSSPSRHLAYGDVARSGLPLYISRAGLADGSSDLATASNGLEVEGGVVPRPGARRRRTLTLCVADASGRLCVGALIGGPISDSEMIERSAFTVTAYAVWSGTGDWSCPTRAGRHH